MDTPIETPKKEILMIAAVILLIGLAIGGYFWWESSVSSDNAGDAASKITENAIKGVLPSMITNPLENKPDVNPADKANPFKNIITNPFD